LRKSVTQTLLSVGSQISFVFPPHKLFFRTHIYQHGSVVKTVILQAIAHARRHQRITGISAYFDYMRVADTIDSQKSEDRDITDKLPEMQLATTKVPRMQSQIFYFYAGKIQCGLYTSYYYFQIHDLRI
jgi:hypothetical protein